MFQTLIIAREKVSQLPDGTYFQRNHWRGKFAQMFDLHDFPFDSHILKLRFHLGCSVEEAEFEANSITMRCDSQVIIIFFWGD